MDSFAKGDIVLFPFPYTDLSSRKLRPCLVLSAEMDDDIILCQITSKRIEKDKYAVELRQNETVKGSLMIDSYIRTNMLFTAATKQIHKGVCRIKDGKYKEVVGSITKIITK